MGNKIKPWHNPEKRPRDFESAQDDRGRSGKGYRNKRERQEQEVKKVDPRRFTTEF